jgi:hypothetical protein
VAKNGRKVSHLVPFSFCATYFIFEKVARNGRKVKAIALLFAHFLPLISFLKNWQKMAEKLRLL